MDLLMYKAVLVDNERLRAEVEWLRAELCTTEAQLTGARADERQAMAYLSAIQKIVGGESYPDMIELVRKQHLEKTHFIDAWSDMCDENQRLRNELNADEALLRQALDMLELCDPERVEHILEALRERLT